MRWTLSTAIALAVALAPIHAADDDEPKLNVGDKAPKFEVKEFVKGDPLKDLAKGKVHVIEFWATWCPPCRESIPHLTELQKKNPEVNFIGVSAYERDFDKVKPFVKDMGDKMDYRVAIDAVPAGKTSDEGAMAKAWMDASGKAGLPAAFIVNGDGVVAWIGHPKEIDKALGDIVAGKWDVKAEALRVKEERVRERKFRVLITKLQKAQESGDAKGLLAAIDAAIQEDAKLEVLLGRAKFDALITLGDLDKAITYGRKLVDDLYKADSAQLNELAWPLVDPERDKKADPKLIKIAVDAAKKGAERTSNKDPNLLDTLACAYFADGDTAKAIETQEKAVKLRPEDDELKAHLEKFKKAVKDKG
jgi:thiol-disulfide isomerase/thioredoxin